MFVKAYNKQLLVSNTLTTIGLLAAGDIFTQMLEKKLASCGNSPSVFGQSFLTSQLVLPATSMSLVQVECKPKEVQKQESFFATMDWSRTGKACLVC